MVDKRTWEEFRNNGLLWWINTILHMFGWAIVTDIEDDVVIDAYLARVKFRGFDEKNVADGYIKVSEYLQGNIEDLVKEAKS